MKGIILAGGAGTRLDPLTRVVSKQLLPVYNKPMICYPLSTLMSCGIRDILIISTPRDLPGFRNLLRDGSSLGIRLSYAQQSSPGGIPQALLIGREFIGVDAVALILGDNLFAGPGLEQRFQAAVSRAEGGCGTVLSYPVADPRRYGIVEFDERGRACSIEEKPENPKSDRCVTGLYFYGRGAAALAATLSASRRGELEITDLNNLYLKQSRLHVEPLGQEHTWMDMGTHESLLEAAIFVRDCEKRQGRKLGCPEAVARINGWISPEE